jgi:DNA polymerase-3 subunit epsilon
MRQVVLDTETTGLEVGMGHRIIEIAGVEIMNRRLTGRHFHRYVNPEREIDSGALLVHGINAEFLQDKPRFCDIVSELIDFVAGAELIIHNAAFDIAFLDSELALLQAQLICTHCPNVIDSLRMARDLHPGKRNSLDALCERYQVNHSARTLHGALLDAQLLAEVYLAMTRGQEALIMDMGFIESSAEEEDLLDISGELIVLMATDEELELHDQYLASIDQVSRGACVWKRSEAIAELH